jgi:hypothetical protein
VELRLRSLDPSNGAGWLGSLARANSSQDTSRKEVALAAISRSDRVDIYWTTLIAHLSLAAAQTKKMSLADAEVIVIGSLAAQAIPAYSVASKSCKGDRLERADIIEVCRGLAKAFEAGDAYITEMIGVAIAKRVWPDTSPEWKAATEARRVYAYRSKLLAKLDAGPWGERTAERYLAMYGRYHREQDALRARLIETGDYPDPPAE